MIKDVSAALLKAKHFAEKQDLHSAALIYAAILEQWPENQEALNAFSAIMLDPSKEFSSAPQVPTKEAPTQTQLEQLITLYQQGQLPEALRQVEALLEQFPDTPVLYLIMGRIAFDRGELTLAVESYQRATDLDPYYADAHNDLGVIFQQMGKHEAAVEALEKVVAIRPDYASAHNNLANALKSLERLDDSINSYQKAIVVDPNYAEAHTNLGILLKHIGRYEESIASLSRALALKPDDVLALSSLGGCYVGLKRFADAISCFRKVVKIQPDNIDGVTNLANTLAQCSLFKEAVDIYQLGLKLDSENEVLLNNIGFALCSLGLYQQAIGYLNKAILLKPDYIRPYNNLGLALNGLHKFAEAIDYYNHAITLDCNYGLAYNNLGVGLRNLGRDHEALKNYNRAIGLNPDSLQPYSNRQYCMSHMEDISPAEQLASAKDYGKVISSQVGARYSSWPVKSASDKLVIGFVSGDFRSHPVGFALEGLLAGIDRSQFELVAFTSDVREDALTARIKPLFSVWVEIFGQDDQSAAELIHRHGVDILIDLSGHTAGNRLPLFAYKAAPVQVSWLGYWSTTGVAEIDYKLGDNFLTPADQDEFFSEQIWRLPNSFLCFAPPAADLPVVPLPAIKTGQVTFGCFNQYSKVTDKVIAVWCDILSGVRGSRLVLKMSALSDDKVVESARARFAVHGISGDQLVLEGGAPYEEYLASYQDIDIALDPFPYPGGATTIESLWMAVPVLTKRGGLLPLSRQGASLMHNTGLSDWIAADDEDYIAKALAFAGDIDALSYLRAGLRQQVLASPLFDSKRFAGDFEIAMQGMWARYSG